MMKKIMLTMFLTYVATFMKCYALTSEDGGFATYGFDKGNIEVSVEVDESNGYVYSYPTLYAYNDIDDPTEYTEYFLRKGELKSRSFKTQWIDDGEYWVPAEF